MGQLNKLSQLLIYHKTKKFKLSQNFKLQNIKQSINKKPANYIQIDLQLMKMLAKGSNILWIVLIQIVIYYCQAQPYLITNIFLTNYTINMPADYTWQVNITDTTINYPNVLMTFPSTVTLPSTQNVTVQCVSGANNITVNASKVGTTSINFTYPPLLQNKSPVVFVVKQIINPASAQQQLTTFTFKMGSYIEVKNTGSNAKFNYLTGRLALCNFRFSGTTQMNNSTLQITITLGNQIKNGTNRKIYIEYKKWVNNDYKRLYNSAFPSLVCSYQVNSVTSAICTGNQTTIQMTFNTSIDIPPNTAVKLNIQGVNNPPTVNSPDQYTVSTSDGQFTIDQTSSTALCNIDPVQEASYSGELVTSTMVNQPYIKPAFNFTDKVQVSFLTGDKLSLSFNDGFVKLQNCSSSFTVARNIGVNFNPDSVSLSSPRTYTVNSNTKDVDLLGFGGSLQIFFDCDILMPYSATPAIFTLTFTRNNSLYMVYRISVAAKPSILDPVVFSANSLQMLANTTYNFNINISQSLGKDPAVAIQIPNQVGVPTVGKCSSSDLSLKLQCSISSGALNTNIFMIKINSTDVNRFKADSSVMISISDVLNPGFPEPGLITFSITTYYDQLISNSKVQFSDNAASFYAKEVRVSPFLSKTNFKVYQRTIVEISYTNKVVLQNNTMFTIKFPNQLQTIIFKNITLDRGTGANLISRDLMGLNASFPRICQIIVKSGQTSIPSLFVFSFQIRVPAYQIDLKSIQIKASLGNVIYEYSSIGMQIFVNQVQTATVQITPDLKMTGQITLYTFKLITSVPHTSPFIFQIAIPSGISYFFNYSGKNAECKANTCSILPSSTSSVLQVQYNGSTLSSQYLFPISFFKNLRMIGSSSEWLFRTIKDSTSNSAITNASAYLSIGVANSLTGYLQNKTTPYYRDNNNSVTMTLYFSNKLVATDILRIRFGIDTYTKNPNQGLSCSKGTCSFNTSTQWPEPLIIDVFSMNIADFTLELKITGLLSNPNTGYYDRSYFTVMLLDQNYNTVDEGTVNYNISCGFDLAIYTCRTCQVNGSCNSCYQSTNNRFLLNNKCQNGCSKQTQYRQFASGSLCQECQNNCSQCYNATACITCKSSNELYYLYQDQTCKSGCEITNGYYNLTNTNSLTKKVVNLCLKCPQNFCLQCKHPNILVCIRCQEPKVVTLEGKCADICSVTSFNDSFICKPCHISCEQSCLDGLGDTDCDNCKVSAGYYRYNGRCRLGCPAGTLLLNGQDCGCTGNCQTCITKSSYCLTCNLTINPEFFAFSGECLTNCPDGTYENLSNGGCTLCSVANCKNCSSVSCVECLPGFYTTSSNQCVSDCKSLGAQYDVDQNLIKCILCPTGCATCSGINCTTCIENYTVKVNSNNISECLRTCSLTNTCEPPVPDKILPAPGVLTVSLWLAVVIVLKFVIPKMYMPYSFVFGGSLIQFVQIMILTINVSDLNIRASSSRLLQLAETTQHYSIVLGILIGSILLNYVMNFIYVFIFCKYMRPLQVSQQQIDRISNFVVLTFCTLTNYRFGLLKYSKVFPKPYIPILSSINLTPVHYLCITSIVLDALPIAACGLILYNDYPFTDQFMISIDILIVISLNIGFSIYFVAIGKNQDYFDKDAKRYALEDGVYNETQANIEGNNKENSKAKIQNLALQEQSINDQIMYSQNGNNQDSFNDYKKFQVMGKNAVANAYSDSQNLPLPLKLSKITAIKAKASQDENKDIHNDSLLQNDSIDFQLKKTNLQSMEINKSLAKRDGSKQRPDPQSGQQTLQQRKRQQPSDYAKALIQSKIKQERSKINQSQTNLKIKKEKKAIEHLVKPTKDQSQTQSDGLDSQQVKVQKGQKKNVVTARQTNSQVNHNLRYNSGSDVNDDPLPLRKSPKSRQQNIKSQIYKKPQQISMKKVKKVGKFQSELDDSQIDELDLSSIIHKKIVAKRQTMDRNNTTTTPIANISLQQDNTNEDISPSWFNIPNQRFDFSDIDSKKSND